MATGRKRGMMKYKIWQIEASIKDSIPEMLEAFRLGKECFNCNYRNNPIECDMCRDETCEKKPNIIARLFFAIRIFTINFTYNLNWYERFSYDR